MPGTALSILHTYNPSTNIITDKCLIILISLIKEQRHREAGYFKVTQHSNWQSQDQHPAKLSYLQNLCY